MANCADEQSASRSAVSLEGWQRGTLCHFFVRKHVRRRRDSRLYLPFTKEKVTQLWYAQQYENGGRLLLKATITHLIPGLCTGIGTSRKTIKKPETPSTPLYPILSHATIHATRRTRDGASRLVHAMSALSVKTPRAPFRHCRDVRVYGHTTTAMQDMK